MLRCLPLACSLIFALAGAAHGQPRLGDELVASPQVWRAFRPLALAVGGGDKDIAVAYLRAASALLRKSDGPIERDAQTEHFQREALASIGDFDLKTFFELLPQRTGPYHAFALQGAPLARGYRLQLGRGDFEVNASSARRGMGDFSSVVRMRHVEAEQKFRYLLEWRAGVGVGSLSWPALAAGATDLLALLEERGEPSARPLLLQTADSQLKKSQPALHEEDRRVLAALWSSFPGLGRLLDSVSTVEDVLVAEPAAATTHVRFVSRWDLPRMQRKFPHLAQFLRDFGKLMDGKVRLLDGRGDTVAELFFDTEHMRSRIELFVLAGQLVPSRAGKPLSSQPVSFETLRAHVDLHMQQFGLHMYVDDLTVELTSERHARGASLAVQIKQTPRVRASGAAFGLFPAGMLDWFIPGDIEGLARKMMDVTMKGNGGRGVTLAARLAQAASGMSTLDGDAAVEILDTALIRFGMKIAAERVLPHEQALAELTRLTLALRDAFSADVERFARYGKLGDHPASVP